MEPSDKPSEVEGVRFLTASRCRAVIDGTKLILQLSPTDEVLVESPNKLLLTNASVSTEQRSASRILLRPSYSHNDVPSTSSKTLEVPATSQNSNKPDGLGPVDEDSKIVGECIYYQLPPPLVIIDASASGYTYFPINIHEHGTVYTREGVGVVMVGTTDIDHVVSCLSQKMNNSSNDGLNGQTSQQGVTNNLSSNNAPFAIKRSKVKSRVMPYRVCNKYEHKRINSTGELNNASDISVTGTTSTEIATYSRLADGRLLRLPPKDNEKNYKNLKEEEDTQNDSYLRQLQYFSASKILSDTIYLRGDESLVRLTLRTPKDRLLLHGAKIIAWSGGVHFECKNVCCFRTVVAVAGNPHGTVWVANEVKPRPPYSYPP